MSLLTAKYEKIFGNGHSFWRAIPPKAVTNLKRWEVHISIPYLDNDGLWHQGYGHGPKAGVPEIIPGSTWTEEYASEVLMDDIRNFGSIIDKWISVPVTDYMFGAVVSLAYNVGPGRLKNESKVLTYLNEGKYTKAAAEFLTLNSVEIEEKEYVRLLAISPELVLIQTETGEFRKRIDGLTLRRCCEVEVFMTQVWKNETK